MIEIANESHRDKIENEPIVRVVNVARTYRLGGRDVPALKGVSLEVEAGHFIALKGRSGSGKTTLLNLIGGLDQPTSGEVFIYGKPLSGLSERQMTELRRNRIGFVFQSFALLPTFSAYENAELPLRIAGLGGREREERTWRCLEIVGIANRAHHRPYEMSGGQQQRVAIARALVNSPGLILADEPTGELDSTSGRKVMDLFQQISVEEKVAVIMATHDPMVEEYAEMIYELKDGQVINVIDSTAN